jgi:hypothetical protein
MLNGLRAGLGANGVEVFLARVAVVAGHADLDQLVACERTLDFRQHGRSEAVVADHDHGFQGMGTGTQFAALGRRECFHGAILSARSAVSADPTQLMRKAVEQVQ